MKLYGELAEWWPVFSPPEHYVEEAAELAGLLREAGAPAQGTLLELGSGGGSNAFHLKHDYALTLVDLSPEMLAISRDINPECEHLTGDMRSVRLGRTFDVVFVHDAVMYMTTEAKLRSVMETAFAHCTEGGLVLMVPDCVRENFGTIPETKCGGEDNGERGLRYLSWTRDPDPTDTTYEVHFAIMLREGDTVRVEHDAHVFGLFRRADWLHLLEGVGFAPRSVTDSYGREIFVGVKPQPRRSARLTGG